MNRVIMHIDFNSFFATIEQQANPRLRGKPIAVTGGDRLTRTVVGAASIEAKRLGIKTGMNLQEALRIYPDLILVKGDSDKYLSCTKKFLNILKDYSPLVEVFSIDEAFIQLVGESDALSIAERIKQRVRIEIGEWVTCSIGISYNKRMAKLAGSMYKQSLKNLPSAKQFVKFYKPDGIVVIKDEKEAIWVLDRVQLDEICGIGFRIKKRLNNMGVFSFADLRKVDLENLLASFKSYGKILYDMSRGIDETSLTPFFEKEEVKSIGHRHTTSKDIDDPLEIKQLLLKLSELVARKLRSKKLVGKTVSIWFRYGFSLDYYKLTGHRFSGGGMQTTINLTDEGIDIFNAGWKIFLNIWNGDPIRMIGISVSNLCSQFPTNLSFLEDDLRKEKIINTLDKVNDKYGEFTLFRGILLNSIRIRRRPNAFLADYRFKISSN